MEIGDSTRTSAALLDGISAVLQIYLPVRRCLQPV